MEIGHVILIRVVSTKSLMVMAKSFHFLMMSATFLSGNVCKWRVKPLLLQLSLYIHVLFNVAFCCI